MRPEPPRVRVPDDNDINRVFLDAKRGFVAVAGTTKGQLIYLNIAFRSGDIDTVYLDERGAGRLIAALKALAPAKAGIAASRATLASDGETEVQEGVLRDDED